MPTPPPIDLYLKDGDVLAFGDERVTVCHVPGHSPGHVMLHTPTDAWVGDCVFQDSIGRTDLPGGDTRTLMNSIFQRILPLGDAVRVHCGHGPDTTLKREREHNPFIAGWVGSSLNQRKD
jgi:glyoxylase-like metal-dependent hydrolase (beta-lactamase superfamily II)